MLIGTFATAPECLFPKEMSVRSCCADTDTENSLREWKAALIGLHILRGFALGLLEILEVLNFETFFFCVPKCGI